MEGSMVGALRILLRASMTHFGQRLSVVRGKPSGGLDFCQDLSRGLSDHFGVNDSFGLYWLKNWIVLKRPPATVASAFSACLIGFILRPFISLRNPLQGGRPLSIISKGAGCEGLRKASTRRPSGKPKLLLCILPPARHRPAQGLQ